MTEHNPGEPDFGHDDDAQHNPGEPKFGEGESGGGGSDGGEERAEPEQVEGEFPA
jgi:hypothetical protein